MEKLNRRAFLKYTGAAGGALMLGWSGRTESAGPGQSLVAFCRTEDRQAGVSASIKGLGVNPVKGKDVLIKPNFNTADIAPGSTHNDTLVALVKELWAMGAKSIRLGERSFPPTAEVMAQKGILPLMKELNVPVINFDDLDKKDWVEFKPRESHWQNGFRVARPVIEAECLVSTCCLKTHGFGGIFTMSLKLHVGVVPTVRHGFDYMQELHRSPDMRKMIAEINQAFKPDLVVLDGVDVFVKGGPGTGVRAKGNVFLASADRVAIDSVGVAILKHLGATSPIMTKKIFEQEQIQRAAELGLGASSPDKIDVKAVDDQSQAYRNQIVEILKQG